MELEYFLFILNIIISGLHPIKYIPQIIHTIKTKKVEDLSKANIICELGINILSVTSSVLVYVYMGKKIIFIPIIIEKLSSTIFITTIYYLKKKYETQTYNYDEINPIYDKSNNQINYNTDIIEITNI